MEKIFDLIDKVEVGTYINTKVNGELEIVEVTEINILENWLKVQTSNNGVIVIYKNEEVKGEIVGQKEIVKPKKKGKPRKIKIELKRKGNITTICLKCPKEIEEFFKNLSNGDTQESEVWTTDNKKTEFYTLNDEYKALERNLNLDIFNNYGTGLMSATGEINIAPLRTKGVSKGKGIVLSSHHFSGLNNLDLEHYVRKLGLATKKLWANVIGEKKVSAEITFCL